MSTMTMKTTTIEKKDIASVATIENTSNIENSPSMEESKPTSFAKVTKSNEDTINISERKTPEEDRFVVSYDKMNEINIEETFLKNIDHRTEIVFKINKYTIPVILQFFVIRYFNKINVFDCNTNIFEAMKLVDNTTVMITLSGTTFEHPKEFPPLQDYINAFPSGNQIQKQHKIFVCCQVESSIRMGEFRYDEKSVMHNLINLNTFMKHNKFNTHQENSIGWFKFTNSVLSLQQTTREYTINVLLNVYLSEDDIKTLQTNDENKNEQYEVRIPAFDIHHKIISNGNKSERITTSAYEIYCHPTDSKKIKVLLAKYYVDPKKKFTFIPFGLAQMASNSTYRR